MDRIGLVGQDDAATRLLVDLLGRREREIAWWCPDPEGDCPREDPPGDDASRAHTRFAEPHELADTPLIFFTTPMRIARDVARELGQHLDGRHVLIHTLRALEPDTLATASSILVEETPTRRVGLLTGPMRREDVDAEQGVAAVCASHFPECHELVEEVLATQILRLYRTEDLVGAEVAAALTRVMAVAGGIADGLGRGASVTAILFARGLAEIARFVEWCGGLERTCFGMAGAGNLFADVHPPGSSDFRLGVAAARYGNFEIDRLEDPAARADAAELAELVDTLGRAAKRAELDLHILRACHALIAENLGIEEAARLLMQLPVLDE